MSYMNNRNVNNRNINDLNNPNSNNTYSTDEDLNEKDLNERFSELGLSMPEILLPSFDADFKRWAVVACDQYTSEPEYWQQVESFVGESPSTLRLILPEVYLEAHSTPTDTSTNPMDIRIKMINEKMYQYLENDVVSPLKPGFVYVERRTARGRTRKGLVVAVDLEKYDFSKGSKSMIRATEGTVLERLPPRVLIRSNALLELTHILILIDDPDKSVIEPIGKKICVNNNCTDKINGTDYMYDTDLMMNSGHIKGYHINDPELVSEIASALEKLAAGLSSDDKMLFAVGDGNHSLASAKVHWENVKAAKSGSKSVSESASESASESVSVSKSKSKSESESISKSVPKSESVTGSISQSKLLNHPTRYALVEIVNIHDEGIVFEPIHRILFNVDKEDFFGELETAGAEIISFNIPAKLKNIGNNEFFLQDKNEEHANPNHKNHMNSKNQMDCCNNPDFQSNCDMTIKWLKTKQIEYNTPGTHQIPFISGETAGIITFPYPSHSLEYGTLQAFLDNYLSKLNALNKLNPINNSINNSANNTMNDSNNATKNELKNPPRTVTIDYVHGNEIIVKQGIQPENISFVMPSLDKFSLFPVVMKEGALPRKTFSMGEADEKRFYMECRKIK